MNGGMVDGSMVDGSMVCRGMVDRLIMRLARVLDVGDVAGIGVIDMVGHSLEAAIRKLDMVLALGGVAVAALAGTKVKAVLIGDAVLVRIVGGGGLIVGLMVAAFMVRGGGMVDGGGMMDRGMVQGSMVHRGMVDGSMVRWPMVCDSRGSEGSNEDEVLKSYRIDYHQFISQDYFQCKRQF